MIEAWQHATGDTITVAVVEAPFDQEHIDLHGNISSQIPSNQPSGAMIDEHATNVAGILGATTGNGKGMAAVAPDANIVSLSDLYNYPFTQSSLIDVYNASWGPYDGTMGITDVDPLTTVISSAAIATANGSSVVFSNGNGGPHDQSAYDAIVSSTDTIAVTSVTDWASLPSYNELGSNIVISAYSGVGVNGITTTSMDNNFIDDFTGTSASAPLVSGIIALMLENNDLTQRDVQSILINTALMIDMDNSSWGTNLAGYTTSNQYGYGVIDAEAAVLAAQNSDYLISDHQPLTEILTSDQFTNSSNGDSVSIINRDLIAEQVVLNILSIDYFGGDENLQISLTHELNNESFSSTLFLPTITDTQQSYDAWSALSVQHFGESLEGEWNINILDTVTDTYLDGDQFEVELKFYYYDASSTI